MHRFTTTLAALALSGGLLGLAPQPSSAAVSCADPAHPIDGFNSFEVAVGTKHSQIGDLGVSTRQGCGVDRAVAVVTSPRKTYRIPLTKVVSDDPISPQAWTGSLRLKPADLRNSDAGVWPVRYEVSGQNAANVEIDGHVRRATRATFNAGPEPVRKNKITYTGRLERADWNTGRYRGLAQTVQIETPDKGGEDFVIVATPKTHQDGTYRKTKPFPGANKYWMSYAGTSKTAATGSRPDWVAAP